MLPPLTSHASKVPEESEAQQGPQPQQEGGWSLIDTISSIFWAIISFLFTCCSRSGRSESMLPTDSYQTAERLPQPHERTVEQRPQSPPMAEEPLYVGIVYKEKSPGQDDDQLNQEPKLFTQENNPYSSIDTFISEISSVNQIILPVDQSIPQPKERRKQQNPPTFGKNVIADDVDRTKTFPPASQAYSSEYLDKFVGLNFDQRKYFFDHPHLSFDQVIAQTTGSVETDSYQKTTGEPINPFALPFDESEKDDEVDILQPIQSSARFDDTPDTQKPTTQQKLDEAFKKGKVWFSVKCNAAHQLLSAGFTSVQACRK